MEQNNRQARMDPDFTRSEKNQVLRPGTTLKPGEQLDFIVGRILSGYFESQFYPGKGEMPFGDLYSKRILDQEIRADSKQSTGIEFQQLIHGFASGTARFIRIMDCKNCMICIAVTMPVFWSGINYKRNKGLAEFFF